MIEFSAIKNITKLASASLLAKLIGFVSLPLLAKYYSPEHFGLWAACSSSVAFLVVLFSLKLDLASFIEEEENLSKLVSVQIMTALAVCIVSTSLIWFCKMFFPPLGSVQVLDYWLVLVGISLAQVFILLTNTLLNVEGEFGLLSKFRLIQSILFYILCFSLVWLAEFSEIIMFCWASSILISALLLELKVGVIRARFSILSLREIKAILTRWRGFVAIKLPSTLLELGTVFVFYSSVTAKFGLEVLGIFYLTTKVMSAPALFISMSFKEVFKKTIADKYKNREHLAQTYRWLSAFSFVVAVLVIGFMIFVIDTFGSYLPSAYKGVEDMVYIVAPLIFFQFLAAPMGFLPQVLNMQKGDFFIQALMFVFVLILISSRADISTLQAFYLYVFASCVKYVSEICYSIYCLRKYEGT